MTSPIVGPEVDARVWQELRRRGSHTALRSPSEADMIRPARWRRASTWWIKGFCRGENRPLLRRDRARCTQRIWFLQFRVRFIHTNQSRVSPIQPGSSTIERRSSTVRLSVTERRNPHSPHHYEDDDGMRR
jgi:hypothetical protein